jgi:adenosylcobyric acid synthase
MQKENIFGTYVHGIFDNEDLAYRLVSSVAEAKGLSLEGEAMDYQAFKEKEYDKLADVVRESLDMDYVYKITGILK